ncbi:hypothetical protein ACI6Q5_01985 [Xanthomonas codiaei]|uniref:ABC-type transport auxiliary lipoprotein component domain-containing protein n=1 Tax=Xanthomonas codiaei TaxID=56463 RepID=A0A2S7CRG3_9XANT|nr:hypothetical protein [Xanthomonas codiaei]PPU64090.1 hypothetical protein XcodCFBP4690_10635 [Xanthomonas codiaei]
MSRASRILIVVLLCLLLPACVSLQAPRYQPGIDNSAALLRQPLALKVGSFGAAAGVENHSLSLRGNPLKSGGDGTYAGYLRDALIDELRTGRALSAGNAAELRGTLTRNIVNAAGVRTGRAQLAARFVVLRDGHVAYDRELAIEHQWEASFIGAVAVSAATDNYGTAVQKLIGALVNDPAFIAAARDR